MTHLNEISKVYVEKVAAKPDFLDLDNDGNKKEPMKKASKEVEPPKERLKTDRDMFSIPKAEREAARERLLKKAKERREKVSEGLDPVGKEDDDIDNDGVKNDNNDKYIRNKRNKIRAAMMNRKQQNEEKNVHGEIEVPSGNIKKLSKKAKERIDIDVDGDVEHNDKHKGEYGEFIPSPDGKGKLFTGPKKVRKEGFSNWRSDLIEVVGKVDNNEKVTEKKVNNAVKTSAMGDGIKIGEAITEIGGTLIEMVETEDVDFIIESVYDELLGEGYGEDDIEEALEYALNEATVTFGHDTPTGKKKRGNLVSAVGRLARKKLSSKVRGAKKAAGAAVASGARKVAKGALGVARKMEGGDKTPSSAHTKTRSASTYRGAGAGQKEKVSSGSYTAPSKKKAEKPSDPWEGSATTPPKAKTKKTASPKATKKTTKVKEVSKKKKSNLDNLLASIRNEEINLDEKALSKAQQRFMGMVYAVKRGDMKSPSKEVASAALGMSKKEAKKFAKTKHEGLPEKKKVDESVMSNMNTMDQKKDQVANGEKDKKTEIAKIKMAKMRELQVKMSALRKGVIPQ